MRKALIYTTNYCPYCHRALKLLKEKDFEIENVDVTNDKKKWDEVAEKTGISTVPQIFIDDIFIGGCDDLIQLDKAGKL